MKLRFALFVLSLVIGVGACGGSMLAFMSIEPLRKGQSFAGLESSMLQGTPFTTFLIPGVFLLIVLGLGNLLFSYLDHCSSDFIKGRECFASDFLSVRFTPARCGSLLYQTLATLGSFFCSSKLILQKGFMGEIIKLLKSFLCKTWIFEKIFAKGSFA